MTINIINTSLEYLANSCHSLVFTNTGLDEISHLQQSTATINIIFLCIMRNFLKDSNNYKENSLLHILKRVVSVPVFWFV